MSQQSEQLQKLKKEKQIRNFRKKVNQNKLLEAAIKYKKWQWKNTTRLENLKKKKKLQFILRRLRSKKFMNKQKQNHDHALTDSRLDINLNTSATSGNSNTNENINQSIIANLNSQELKRKRQSEIISQQEDVQISTELLNEENKQEYPNEILFYSFNTKIQKANTYIPGNWIHKQFSAFMKWWIKIFYQSNGIGLTAKKFITEKEINKLKEKIDKTVNQVIQICSEKNQNKNLKLQLLAYEIKQYLTPKQKTRYGQQESLNDELLYKNLPKINKQVREFTGIVAQVLGPHASERIQKFFSTQFNSIFRNINIEYDSVDKKLKERQKEQRNFRNKLEDIEKKCFNNCDLDKYFKEVSEKKQKEVRKKLKQLQRWQLKNMPPIYWLQYQYLNQNHKTSSSVNFGMGRLSYVDQNNRYVVFKPFEFNLQECQKKSEKKKYQQDLHSERQIMKKAKQKIQQFGSLFSVRMLMLNFLQNFIRQLKAAKNMSVQINQFHCFYFKTLIPKGDLIDRFFILFFLLIEIG